MVTRKPVPQQADGGLAPYPSSPPYPVTPTSKPPTSQDFRVQDAREQLRNSVTDSEPESPNAWRDDDEAPGEYLSASKTGKPPTAIIPESLRVGPASLSNSSSREPLRVASADVSRASSNEQLRPDPSTNPFVKKHMQDGSENRESSAGAWGNVSELSAEAPKKAPPPIPQHQPPIQGLANLSVSEPSTNPWQPALNKNPRTEALPIPTMRHEDSGNEAWSSAPPAKKAPAAPQALDTSQQPVLVDIEEPESPAWDEDEPSPIVQEMPSTVAKESQQISDDSHAWDNDQGHNVKPVASEATPFVAHDDTSQSGEGWNLVNHETVADGAQQSGIISSDQSFPAQSAAHSGTRDDIGPPLPPRTSTEIPLQRNISEEHAPAQPPRPVIVTDTPSSTSVNSQGPNSAVRKQKKETYEIKKITWHDVNASQNPRTSPILVQNLNGPCPLLALVNALTLSTPAGVDTALIETLRSREQVSLGLLLDAVFDELMSGRRGGAAQELPDVSDLYSFLITLHTGMNVNPRFSPPAANKSSTDPRNSMSHVHPSEREAALPGTFEDTREMKLYSTFAIPLIHGWLPELDSPAYAALCRSAQSYEEAQNIMFNEEPLEDKLRHEGLSFEEQAKLEDIGTIKAFFTSNATQLTSFGLSTITTSVAPGAVAILFRNDHFSTLYRHPQTLQLLQLVTDMGYAGHEEVVWESLIDVNGENAEFFSGDFRLVGGAPATSSTAGNAHESGNGWTAVAGSRGSANHRGGHQPASSLSSIPQNVPSDLEPPQSPTTEQEDHDLALALQLQEEEEQRHEQEMARRRRETELSQQYIEQSGAGRGANSRSGNNVPVTRGRGGTVRGRGAGRGAVIETRPEIPPRRNNQANTAADPEAGVDAPPPSYEQAANQPAYAPPTNHPAHPSSSPVTARRESAYSANSARPQIAGRGRRATGTSSVYQDQGPNSRPQQVQRPGERERDCIVM